MSRAKAVAAILVFVVLPVVLLLIRLLPEPIPEALAKQVAYHKYLREHCPGPIHLVFREPEPCDVVWLSPEARQHQAAIRRQEDENRRRLEAFLAYLKTEREQHRDSRMRQRPRR
jgi:hypothetical protein